MGKGPTSAGRLTILWHAIPEDRRLERARLARSLRFLGFGSLQDGTWISPHDRESQLADVITDLGVGEFTGVLIGRPAASFDFHRFVSRVWSPGLPPHAIGSEQFAPFADGRQPPSAIVTPSSSARVPCTRQELSGGRS